MQRHPVGRLLMALAPIAALMACDQLAGVVGGAGGGDRAGGPATLQSVALDARAVAGAVRPAAEMAALLEAEQVMVAPGQIVVGAQVEQQLDESAAALGLARSMVTRLRTEGADALEDVPAAMLAEVRTRAETAAASYARQEANRVLGRLGIDGEVNIRPGGVVTIDLSHASGVSPTALPLVAQEATTAAPQQESQEPQAIAWSNEACPRLVNADDLERDIGLAMRCAIARLESSGQFEYVDPNFIATVEFDRLPVARPSNPPPAPTPTPTPTPSPAAGALPNDPLESLQWHYRVRGTQTGQSPGGAGFEAFWVQARQTGSRAVRVAVVDTGLDTRHPEIAGSPNVAAGVDLITNTERAGDDNGADADAYDSGDRCGTATEHSYHGTHVAGTVGAVRTNNRVGVAGGAWNVTIVPVRVLGRCGGELADIASGIRWAAGVAPAVLNDGRQLANGNPADIINLSLSVGVPCPSSMQAAIDAAVARGAVIVVAAGNRAGPTRNYAPANCNNVIVVGANDERGNMSFYSNFGPEVDVLAPGGDVFADRDSDGRPDGVLSARSASSGCYDPAGGAGAATCHYTFLQGTSMAAPHVSAALALLAAQTGLRGRELENALFTRALGQIGSTQCRIECARNANATPIPSEAGMCQRACGRGMLDLARAAASPAAASAGGGAPRR